MALLLVISPIFEADLCPEQYGFRPGVDAKMAIRRAYFHVADRGLREVVDADLSDYFNTIPHGALMRCLSRRIADSQVLSTIRQWLRMPVVERTEGGERRTTEAADKNRGVPQGSPLTPPTILQTAPIGARDKRGWAYLIYHSDVLSVDLDSFDQGPEDFPPRKPIGLLETIKDVLGELIELPYHQSQFLFLEFLFFHRLGLRLQLRQPLFGDADARLKLTLAEQAVFIGIDQPRQTAFYFLDHLCKLVCLAGLMRLLMVQPPLILVGDSFGMVQQCTDVLPHRGFQHIRAQLFCWCTPSRHRNDRHRCRHSGSRRNASCPWPRRG